VHRGWAVGVCIAVGVWWWCDGGGGVSIWCKAVYDSGVRLAQAPHAGTWRMLSLGVVTIMPTFAAHLVSGMGGGGLKARTIQAAHVCSPMPCYPRGGGRLTGRTIQAAHVCSPTPCCPGGWGGETDSQDHTSSTFVLTHAMWPPGGGGVVGFVDACGQDQTRLTHAMLPDAVLPCSWRCSILWSATTQSQSGACSGSGSSCRRGLWTQLSSGAGEHSNAGATARRCSSWVVAQLPPAVAARATVMQESTLLPLLAASTAWT
jgi:hypothetical protein